MKHTMPLLLHLHLQLQMPPWNTSDWILTLFPTVSPEPSPSEERFTPRVTTPLVALLGDSVPALTILEREEGPFGILP